MRFKYVALILVAAFLGGAFMLWSASPKFVGRPTEPEFSIPSIAIPRDVEVDRDGLFYITSGPERRIRIYQPDGTLELQFGHPVPQYKEDDPTGFIDMQGLALDQDNNIYIAEKKGRRIRVFNPYGEPLLVINTPDYLISIINDAGQRVFKPTSPPEARKLPGKKYYDKGAPYDIAVSANGNIYASDSYGQRIMVFDYEGNVLTTFDFFRVNNSLTPFRGPGQLGFNSKGELFVSLEPSCFVVTLDAKGNYLRHFGGPGNIVGTFQRPTGLTIDDLDRVYVADFVIGSVQVFDDQGNFLHVLTNKTNEQWTVGNLMGLAVTPKRIFLTEPLSNQVHVRKFVK